MCDPEKIPSHFGGEIPAKKVTVEELYDHVGKSKCPTEMFVTTWQYETFLYKVWNFFRPGYSQRYLTGTKIQFNFYCCSTRPDPQELRRKRRVSRNFRITECKLEVIDVFQPEKRVLVDWQKWMLGILFRDSKEDKKVQASIALALTTLELSHAGRLSTAASLTGLGSKMKKIFGESTTILADIDEETTKDWVADGPPVGKVIAEFPLTPELCEMLKPMFTDPVTVPAEGEEEEEENP